MPNIKLGSKTFENVEKINISLADGTGQVTFSDGITPEYIEWHQCPDQPRKFVEEVTYDPSDYTASEIENYAPSIPLVSNYKPIGYTVDGIYFYNEVPNVEKEFQTENSYGTVKPLDQVRIINTPSAPNVRDIGGWACDGGTIKYGKLFRGGYLSSDDREVLVEELGIRHDLDLRGTSEAGITISPLGEDVYYTCADKYNCYSTSINDAWKTNIRCVFDAVTHNEPVYFHCAAGADRTGTLACVLEGLLGVSQSDIDKDYELTSFYSGTYSDNAARRRNETDWQGMINSINAYTGDTFRDKCINFVAQLGFTVDEVNAYRKGMIDGTPDEISFNVEEYIVTNNLTDASTSNLNTITAQYQQYTANIVCSPEYVIDSVEVLMDGVDITKSVWKGTETNLYRSVILNLTNCSMDNSAKKVIDGQGYAATISVNTGYTLDGAEAIIMMGGTDVTNKYYKNGVIAIPNVTGNLEINISAVDAYGATNLIDIYGISDKGVRLSASGGNNTASNGSSYVVGATMDEDGIIPFNTGDVFYIYGAIWGTIIDANTTMVAYNDSGERCESTYLYDDSSISSWFTLDSLNNLATITPSGIFGSECVGIRFSLVTNDSSNLIITRNTPPDIEYATECSVTYNLSNCVVHNNGVTSVNIGDSFYCSVEALDSDTADTFDILRVSMGCNDIYDDCVTIVDGSVSRASGDAGAAYAEINIPSVTGNVIITAVSGSTDVVSTSIDSDSNIYNGTGYSADKRINSSGTVVDYSGDNNNIVTGFIPVSDGDTFYFKDGYVLNEYQGGFNTTLYNESFSSLSVGITPYDIHQNTYINTIFTPTIDDVGMGYSGVTKLIFNGYSNAKYIRFTLERPSADSVPVIYKANE